MNHLPSRNRVPEQVSTIRRLMLVYVGALVLGMLAVAASSGSIEHRELFRGLLRIAAFSYLIWWLPSLDKDAWWVSVFACGLLALLGVLVLLFHVFLGMTRDPGPLMVVFKLVLPVYALAHAFVILMREETRLHFE